MNKCRLTLLLTVLVVANLVFGEPVFAIVPEVRNVVPYNVGGDTILNVTIYHFPEEDITPHYVNTIEIAIGTDTITFNIGVQPLSADNTFTVQYNLGPMPTPTSATVRAHCTVNGWSAVNWTGVVPEFSSSALLLTLALSTVVLLLVFRKVKRKTER